MASRTASQKATGGLVGRPCKLTPEAREYVVAAVRQGCSRSAAAEGAGIGRSTLQDWLATGRADLARGEATRFADFSDGIKRAEADLQREAVGLILGAARSGSWQAAAWLLERKWPRDYAKRDPAAEEGIQSLEALGMWEGA